MYSAVGKFGSTHSVPTSIIFVECRDCNPQSKTFDKTLKNIRSGKTECLLDRPKLSVVVYVYGIFWYNIGNF